MEENKNRYSVYYHYNPYNNKYYIGITMQEPQKRWGCGGYHYKNNEHFWRAIQRDQWDSFEHVVVETGLSREMAVALEKRLIKECDSYHNGYNNSYGGESLEGYKMAQSIKDKISESNSGENGYWYGKKLPEYMVKKMAEKHINHPSCSRQINQYDINGIYIKTFPSLNEVTRQFGVGVAKALRGEIYVFHGYQWRYTDVCDGESSISAYHKVSKKFKPVIQYDLNGNKIGEYYTTKELRDAGFTKFGAHITNVCHLKRMTYNGYIWRYLREEDAIGDKDSYYDLTNIVAKINSDITSFDKPLGQYDLKGNLVAHFDSCNKAALAIGGSHRNISLACVGGKKSAYGHIWCYDEDLDKLPLKIEYANKKPKRRKINRYTLDGDYIDTFIGIKPAVKQLGFGIPSVIDACCFGMIPNAFGYIWKYAN